MKGKQRIFDMVHTLKILASDKDFVSDNGNEDKFD